MSSTGTATGGRILVCGVVAAVVVVRFCLLARVRVCELASLCDAVFARATYGGLCGMPACGQAVGCGVCDTPELWRGAAGLCARVRACAGADESLHTYIRRVCCFLWWCWGVSSPDCPCMAVFVRTFDVLQGRLRIMRDKNMCVSARCYRYI